MDNRSYASNATSAVTDRARISLLKDLHRPLEEHWKSNKMGLDAMGSDYVYKHHITRLEGIYNSDEPFGIDNKNPKPIANTTPMAQLYGYTGMLVVGEKNQAKLEKREGQWEKHTTLVPRIHPCYERKTTLNDIPPSSKPRSATNSASASPSSRGPSHSHSRSGYSPVPAHVHVPAYNKSNSNSHVRRGRSSSPRSRDAGIDTTPRYTSDYSENDNYHDAERDRDKHMDELFSGKYSSFSPSFARYNADIQHQQQQQLHQSSSVGQSAVGGDAPVRFRCDDPSMPTEEMMYAGLYRLNEQQHEAYRHFVNMLVEYDTTGQLRIIEDAFKDAQVESLLCNFSGT